MGHFSLPGLPPGLQEFNLPGHFNLSVKNSTLGSGALLVTVSEIKIGKEPTLHLLHLPDFLSASEAEAKEAHSPGSPDTADSRDAPGSPGSQCSPGF
jgi:hypothetical protein